MKKSKRAVTEYIPKIGMVRCTHRCADCGRITPDHRCPKCLKKWRVKHGVNVSVETDDGYTF